MQGSATVHHDDEDMHDGYTWLVWRQIRYWWTTREASAEVHLGDGKANA